MLISCLQAPALFAHCICATGIIRKVPEAFLIAIKKSTKILSSFKMAATHFETTYMNGIILTINIKFQCLGRECVMGVFAAFAHIILSLKPLCCSIPKAPAAFCLKTDHLNTTDSQNWFLDHLLSDGHKETKILIIFFLTSKDKY